MLQTLDLKGQYDTQQEKLPREALSISFTQSSGTVVSWKEQDWFMLQMYKEYVKNYPDDVYSKRAYHNYLYWYAHN